MVHALAERYPALIADQSREKGVRFTYPSRMQRLQRLVRLGRPRFRQAQVRRHHLRIVRQQHQRLPAERLRLVAHLDRSRRCLVLSATPGPQHRRDRGERAIQRDEMHFTGR